MTTLKKTLLIIYLLPLTGFSQTKESVLKNYFDAVGGWDKWKEVQSSKQIKDVWQNLNLIGISSSAKSVIDDLEPNKHTSIRRLPYFEFTKLVNAYGSSTQFYINDERSGMVVHNMFFDNPEPSPYVIIDVAVNVLKLNEANLLSYLGEFSVQNRMYDVLLGPFDPYQKNEVKYYFDKKTSLLTIIEHDDIRKTYFDDFREVNGLLTPFKTESFANEVLYFRSIVLEIEFNPLIDMGLFYYSSSSEKKLSHSAASQIRKPLFKDADLPTFINKNYRGKRVLIDLWATWCAPCKIEFTKYDQELYDLLRKSEIELVFISIDKLSKQDEWKKDINQFELLGDHYLAGPKLQKSIKELIYDSNQISIPRYVLVNKNGQIISRNFTKPSAKSFSKDILNSLSVN